MNIGIPVSVFFMGLMLYGIIMSIQLMFQTPTVGIVLPGVDIPGSPIYVPLGYGIIAMAVLMVVHEFGHGILARVEGVRIDSIGVLLLAVLPGAFVEPNEEDVGKSSRMSKLRIYTAGSMFNVGTAIVAFLIVMALSTFVIAPSFHSDGMQITSVVPGSPSVGTLTEGMVIQSINGYSTSNVAEYYKAINHTKIGSTLTFNTNKGVYTVKAGVSPSNSSKAYIGIRSQEYLVVNSGVSDTFGNLVPWIVFPLKELFYWIFLLNLLVGTFNLLPMKPLDGGLILEEILSYKLSEKHVHLIMSNMSWILIAVVLVLVVYGTVPGIMKMFGA
ncbi:Peptidase family M50 [anaerobic digester metagenome]